MLQFPSPHDKILPSDIKLVWPASETQDPVIHDRILGSLIGLAVGDALGASVEFRPRQYLVEHPVHDMMTGGTWGLRAGQWTDDTSMALCLAASLITYRGFNPYDQLVRYKWWYKHGYLSSTGQCFDIGNATRAALEEFYRRQNELKRKLKLRTDSEVDQLPIEALKKAKFDVYCSRPGVAGNGALMRLAPVPLFFYQEPTLAVELSGRSARLTHGDDVAVDACRYYGALIVAAVRGESKEKLLSEDFYEVHQNWFGSQSLHRDIVSIARGSFKRQGGYKAGIRGKGHIVWTLEAALWAFWSTDSFDRGALDAVNLGDDTDTTAAIYGQLAGACYGYPNIPPKWVNKLYANELIACIAEWIQVLGYPETKAPEHQRASRSNIPSSGTSRQPNYINSTQPNQLHPAMNNKLNSDKPTKGRAKSTPRNAGSRNILLKCIGPGES